MAKEINAVEAVEDYPESRKLKKVGIHFQFSIGLLLLLGVPYAVLYRYDFFNQFFELPNAERIVLVVGVVLGILLLCRAYMSLGISLFRRNKAMWKARDQLRAVIEKYESLTQQFRILSDTLNTTKSRHFFELLETNEALKALDNENLEETIHLFCAKGASLLAVPKFSIWFFTEEGKLIHKESYNALTQQREERSVSPAMVQMSKQLQHTNQDLAELSAERPEISTQKYGVYSYKNPYVHALAIPILSEKKGMIGMCWAETENTEKWSDRSLQLGLQIGNMTATAYDVHQLQSVWTVALEASEKKHQGELDILTENSKIELSELKEKYETQQASLEENVKEKEKRIEDLVEAKNKYRALTQNASFGLLQLKLPQPIAPDTVESTANALLEDTQLTNMNAVAEDLLALEMNVVDGKPLGVVVEYPKLHAWVKDFVTEGFPVKRTLWSFLSRTGTIKFVELELHATFEEEDNKISGIWLLLHDTSAERLPAERFRAMFNVTDQMLIAINRDFEILYENPASLRHLGYENTERLAKNFLSYVHPDDFERVNETLNAMVRGEQAKETLLSIQHYSSYQTWVNIDLRLHNLIETPEVRAIVLEATDNTERAAFEEKLQQETDFYKNLIEHKDEVITIVDENGFVQYENAAMQRMFGYDSAMRIGSYGLEYVHTEDVEDLDVFFHKAKESRGVTLEKRVKLLDVRGNWRDVLVGMRRLNGSPKHETLMLTLRDIGKQEAERKREEEEQKLFKSLIQQSSSVYIVTSKEGAILFASDSVKRAFRYNPKELLNRNITTLLEHEEQPKELIRELSADPHAIIHYETKLLNKHKELRQIILNGKTLLYKGNTLGLMFHIEDITDKIREQSELSFKSRFYKALIHATNYYLIFTDFEQQIRFANPAVKQQLGYQLRGRFTDWLHSEDRMLIEEEWEHIVNDAHYTLNCTIRLMNKEGKWEHFILIAHNALRTTNFKGVIVECRMLDEKAITEADKSVERQIGRAMQRTKAKAWGMLNAQAKLVASSKSFYDMWQGDNQESLQLQQTLQEGNLKERFQRMVRKQGDTHAILPLPNDVHLDIWVSSFEEGTLLFVEEQPAELRAFPQLAEREQIQRTLMENIPVGLLLADLEGNVLTKNEMASFYLPSIQNSIYLEEQAHNFVKLADLQHFNSLLSDALLHPDKICSGQYLVNNQQDYWSEIEVDLQAIIDETTGGFFLLWITEQKKTEEEEVEQNAAVEVANTEEYASIEAERNRWRTVAMEEVDRQRELDNQLWLHRKQSLEQQTLVHFGEISLGKIGKAQKGLSAATSAWHQLKEYYYDLRMLLDQYLDISVETNVLNKLQEIRMMKNEIDFDNLFPNMNQNFTAVLEGVSTSKEQLNLLLGLQNEVERVTEFKPWDLFQEVAETFHHHPQMKIHFNMAEDDGEVIQGQYVKLHQLMCAFIHAIETLFTIEEVHLFDRTDEEHTYLKLQIFLYEEVIPPVNDWFNDETSAEHLPIWIAKSLIQAYSGAVSFDKESQNIINITIGVV